MKLIARISDLRGRRKRLVQEPDLYPSHESFRSTANAQDQSPFFSKLPEEIRQLIYVEIWRLSGLAQHVFRQRIPASEHPEGLDKDTPTSPAASGYRFTHSECVKTFSPLDERQDVLQEDHSTRWHWRSQSRHEGNVWIQRYLSPWADHWECWEKLLQAAGKRDWTEWLSTEEDRKAFTSGDAASFPPVSSRARDAFLPMLQTCKATYFECIQSIYETVAFSFTDIPTTERYIGCCHCGPRHLDHTTSPFAKYARIINLSIGCDAPKEVSCVPHHSPWDFHWVGLISLCDLREFNVWIDGYRGPYRARGGTWWKELGYHPHGFVGSSLEAQMRPGVSLSISFPVSKHCAFDEIPPEDTTDLGTESAPKSVKYMREDERAFSLLAGGNFITLRPTGDILPAPSRPICRVGYRPPRRGWRARLRSRIGA